MTYRHSQIEYGEYPRILSVPQNTIMDMNNVMMTLNIIFSVVYVASEGRG